MKIKRSLLMILIVLDLAILATFAAEPVWAGGPELSADLGYGGYLIPGNWMPLRIQVHGGPETARLEIRKHSEDQASISAESYPGRGEIRLESPLFIDNDFTGVRVRLTAGSEVLAVQELQRIKIFPGHLILTLNIPIPLQKAIGTVLLPREPVLIVPISLTDLPGSELSYNGVSRLVAVDPGPVLNPAQLQALCNWLAEGGRLIIYTSQTEKQSLAREIISRAESPPQNSGEVVRIGLGAVTLLPMTAAESPQANQGGYWQRLLNIGPYGENAPLSVVNSFIGGADDLRETNPRSQRLPLLTWAMTGWSILALLAYVLSKRKLFFFRPLYLIILSVVLTIAAIPMGRLIGGAWQRGTVTHVRSVFLPGSGSPLVHGSIYFPKTKISYRGAEGGSPWGVVISGAMETGEIRPGRKLAVWRHHDLSSQYSVISSSDRALELVGRPDGIWNVMSSADRLADEASSQDGVIPLFDSAAEALTWVGSRGTITRVAMWKGDHWFLDRSGVAGGKGQWSEAKEVPKWLKNEAIWFSKIREINPEQSWLVGYGSFPGLDLRIQGGRVGSICWATPFSGGIQP